MNKYMLAAAVLAGCHLSCGARELQKNAMIWYDTNGHVVNAHGGGVLEHEGKYYLYGEHKVYGPAGCRAHVGVHVYSSDNLKDWKDEGIALKVSDDPKSDIADGCVMERPKIIHCKKTGKFVMFFHLERTSHLDYSDGRVGIAVSDTPTGPYAFVRSQKPTPGTYPVNAPDDEKTPEALERSKADIAKVPHFGESDEMRAALIYPSFVECGQDSRDMTLFVDDDGTAYLIHSSEYNSTLHFSELTPDYLDFTGRWWRGMSKDWTEGAAICKKDGWYYLIGSWCTGWDPNQARYYRARSVVGPWERMGDPCRGVNPHNGLGPELTWGAQSNFILKVSDDEYIAMFDMWRPWNQVDSRLVWLPITFGDGEMTIEWRD